MYSYREKSALLSSLCINFTQICYSLVDADMWQLIEFCYHN